MTIDKLRIILNNKGGSLSGIYLIKEKATGKPYVGKAQKITDRIIQHINNKKATSGIDKELADKGIDAFEFDILDLLPNADNNLLLFKEQEWITKLNAKNNGINLTQGNVYHTKKWLDSINNYITSYTVSADIMKLITAQDKNFFGYDNYTLIHEYADEFKGRLRFDGSKINQIQSVFTKQNAKGELKEDSTALAEYINKELDDMKLSNKTDLGKLISNVPYGNIGASIMKRIITDFNFKDCYNLEPGNDYFYGDTKLYKYIDPSFRPIICRNGCFKDASQTTVITKLQKEENNLSELDARILLHIDTKGDEALLEAITEYIRKAAYYGTLRFVQKTDVIYNDDLFVFNPGAFDIHHGYLAVYNSKKKAYTSSTNFNLFKQDTIGHKNSPTAAVKGCKGFKKIFYSNAGLQFLYVLFSSSPEGWGFLNGFFADIDYSNLTTVVDLFNALGLSASSQNTLLSAMSKVKLSSEEKRLEAIVRSL